MADRRPGGIEKIAHLFITGPGPAAIQNRNGSSRCWTSRPLVAGGDGDGNGSVVPPTAALPPGQTGQAPPREPPGAATAAPPAPRAVPNLEPLLAQARVMAVLSAHMGPLAGPAAEACARILASSGQRVAMLYGPADYACLHCFHVQADAGGQTTRQGDPGNDRDRSDLLLLPDWVFQFDLWPACRPSQAICLAYGAGSQGLMAAYGALKGQITRFGEPQDLLVIPFGCDSHEEEWGRQRLTEMCRRFLRIDPDFQREARPDVRVRAGDLVPIQGGAEGVKHMLNSIGQVRLTVVEHAQSQPQEQADAGSRAIHLAEDVTPLVGVPSVPADGEEVLHALVRHLSTRQCVALDVWRRQGLAGAIVGASACVGGAEEEADPLSLALWLCRQARLAGIDPLEEVVVAVRHADPWLLEAAQGMPVPVRWLAWRAFELDGRLGLSFEPLGQDSDD